MRWKLFIEFCITVFAIGVLAGDLFLPQPYRAGSQQLKTHINHFLVGLFPNQSILKIKSKENNSI